MRVCVCVLLSWCPSTPAVNAVFLSEACVGDTVLRVECKERGESIPGMVVEEGMVGGVALAECWIENCQSALLRCSHFYFTHAPRAALWLWALSLLLRALRWPACLSVTVNPFVTVRRRVALRPLVDTARAEAQSETLTYCINLVSVA